MSCPPFELIEIAVLGGLVRQSFDTANDVKARVDKNSRSDLKFSPDKLVREQLAGTEIGLRSGADSQNRSKRFSR